MANSDPLTEFQCPFLLTTKKRPVRSHLANPLSFAKIRGLPADNLLIPVRTLFAGVNLAEPESLSTEPRCVYTAKTDL